MLCLAKWVQRRCPSTGIVPWIWAIPISHTQIEAGPDTRKDTGSSAAWISAQSLHTLFPPFTKRCTKYASWSAKS